MKVGRILQPYQRFQLVTPIHHEKGKSPSLDYLKVKLAKPFLPEAVKGLTPHSNQYHTLSAHLMTELCSQPICRDCASTTQLYCRVNKVGENPVQSWLYRRSQEPPAGFSTSRRISKCETVKTQKAGRPQS